MTDSDYSIVFAGTPDYALPSLKALYDRYGSNIVVISQPDRRRGRGKQVSPTPIKQFALDHSLTVHTPESKDDLACLMQTLSPDLMIVIAYGMILPKSITDSIYCVNLHGSLLPAYRGASPMQASLLNADAETGVTLIHMNEKMDDGDILAKQVISLNGDETLGILHDRLADLSAEVMMTYLADREAGKLHLPEPQDISQATYCHKLSGKDFELDLSDLLSSYRKIKAFSPFPGAYTMTKSGKRVKILDANWEDDVLTLTKVKPEGKSEMSYHDYLLSHDALL